MSFKSLLYCFTLLSLVFPANWHLGSETSLDLLLFHFEETSPIWDYSEALWLESSRGRKAPHPSGRILLLKARTSHVSR